MKPIISSTDQLILLGIKPKFPQKKIVPNGKDYSATREIVKFLNKKLGNGKNKFVGFFPNVKNVDKSFIILTSDYYLHYTNSSYSNYQKAFNLKYPNTKIKYLHAHDSKVYFPFKEGEGLYII